MNNLIRVIAISISSVTFSMLSISLQGIHTTLSYTFAGLAVLFVIAGLLLADR